MKTRRWIILSLLILIPIAVGVAIRQASVETTLSFKVLDSVSGGWVWDLEARLQNRLINGYYQSDIEPYPGFTFTHLDRGDFILELAAPHYKEKRIPVTIKTGENVIAEPIEMVGFEIPDLDKVLIFESNRGQDINGELRPVNSIGLAIENHPCMDIWIGAEVSVQLKDGAPISEPAQEGSTRGQSLYKGSVEWFWDPSPETLFRYSFIIPSDRMIDHPASYVIIDYLVALRDPRIMTGEQMEQILGEVWDISDTEDFLSILESYEGISFYFDTSWNVQRP